MQRLPIRVKASLVHFCGSLLAALLLIAVVFFVWYPAPYGEASGALPIFAMLFGVDVVLGPFITLIIFNPKKRSLPFDMAVIILIQLAALAYGTHSLFVARPAYVVFNVDRFDVVLANEVDSASAARATEPGYRAVPWTGPTMVGADVPKEREAREKMLFGSVGGGADLPQMPEYFKPLAALHDEIRARAKSLDELRRLNPKAEPATLGLLDQYRARGDAVGFVPMKAKTEDLSVIVDKESGKVLAILSLQPW